MNWFVTLGDSRGQKHTRRIDSTTAVGYAFAEKYDGGATMAVTDGIALAAWEHLRATQDVDVLIAIGDTDVDGLLRRLQEAQIRPKEM